MESVDKVKRQFDTLNRSFDELATTRRRALERPLNAIEDLRRKQQLPIDGQLFEVDAPRGFDAEFEHDLDNVRELGA
jgi:DNA recombination protein RmuC